MKCTSLIQATRVAKAGAAKMDKQGYTITQNPHVPHVFRVVNPDGKGYRVSLDADNHNCACAFFAENRQYKTCKHIERAKQEKAQIDADEAAIARWEEIEEAKLDAGYYLN